MACYTIEQENHALAFLDKFGPSTAQEVAAEIDLKVAHTKKMLAAMIRAHVVEAIPMYRIRPLVKASGDE